MRRVVLALALVTAAPSAASAGDPAPPRKKPPVVVEVPGVRFEREFEPALRRATREGRPVLFCVNALVDSGETGNVAAATERYPSPEMGEPSRTFVCFVCNPNAHDETTLGDGSRVCSRYGVGTCACHQDALRYVLRVLSADGQTVISPSHWILEPDGLLVAHEDYVQGVPTGAALDAWAVVISPRLAMRRAWLARDEKLSALAKMPPAEEGKAAAAWVASDDRLAVAGVGALLDQETDPARRAALLSALSGARPESGVPVLFDAVDAATADPKAQPEGPLPWVAVARAVDPDFGAWAAARALVRTKDADQRRSLLAAAAGEKGLADPASLPASVRGRLAEALLLCGDPSSSGFLGADAEASLPPGRLDRARRVRKPATPEALASPRADERREAVLGLDPKDVVAARAKVAPLLSDPSVAVRVAAALALLRAGDRAGADLALWAVADPVEGCDARAFLAAMNGGNDLGDAPGAWEAFVRGTEGGGR